jgi:nitrogen regulatory protein P-II 1
VVRPEILEKVIEKIAAAARTGEVGDGKIFVFNVEEAVRIRTGERGPETVQHAERAMWGH